MVSHEERQRLVQAHAEEPVCVAAVIAKCSVCLALLVGIAALGTVGGSFDEPVQAQNGGPAVTKVSNAR